MFRRTQQAQGTDPKPSGPVNSMERLQLSLHQHGASLTIAVELAKRANTHELDHLHSRIEGEMRQVKDIVHEATNVHKRALHFPRIVLSTREEFVKAQKEQRPVNWHTIARDDTSIQTSPWYQDVETPRTSPGPQRWWCDVRKAMETREAATAASAVVEGQSSSSKRKRDESAHNTSDVEMEVDAESNDEADRRKRSKGKGRAMETDAEEEVDSEAARQAEGVEAVRKEKGKARASDARRFTPADDATMQPGQTSCTRCLRLGRMCSAVLGSVCSACHKSKVSCPLFTGGKQPRSRAPSRVASVAPALLPASKPGPSSAATAPPTDAMPAGSTTIGTPSAIPSAVWDEEEGRIGPYRRVRTFFLPTVTGPEYRAPRTAAPPALPVEAEEKALKTSRRGRSSSRPPARTPTVLSTPAPPREKLTIRIPSRSVSGAKSPAPASSRSGPRSSKPATNGKMESDPLVGPSAGPSNRRGRARVFVDIPSIDSLEEYSPLLTGDNHTAPTSVATKMAQMENEIRALKRAHEALRQYVISILPPQQPAADSLTRPPTESLPNIGADTFPHPQTNGLGQAPTDASTSTRQDEVAELMPTHVEVALANVEVDIGPTDVEMVPAGDVDRQPGGQNAGVAAEEFRAG